MDEPYILEIIPELLDKLFLTNARTLEDKQIILTQIMYTKIKVDIADALDKHELALVAKLGAIFVSTLTLVHEKVNTNKKNYLLEIILSDHLNLDERLIGHHTILSLTAKYCKGHAWVQCLQSLITHGAKVNTREGKYRTPLMFAAKYCNNGDCSCMQILLEASAYIDAKDARGNTALMLAAKYCNKSSSMECIKFLIQRGAKVDIENVTIFSSKSCHAQFLSTPST